MYLKMCVLKNYFNFLRNKKSHKWGQTRNSIFFHLFVTEIFLNMEHICRRIAYNSLTIHIFHIVIGHQKLKQHKNGRNWNIFFPRSSVLTIDENLSSFNGTRSKVMREFAKTITRKNCRFSVCYSPRSRASSTKVIPFIFFVFLHISQSGWRDIKTIELLTLHQDTQSMSPTLSRAWG